MAHHHHHRIHHHRLNPFGLSMGVVKDSAYNAMGALGSMFISSKIGQTGWMDVAATAASAIGLSMLGKSMGGDELLKGGLTATLIKALHQAGFASSLGLGSYAPSWFGVPTASSQYLRAYNANIGPAARGQGTIYVATGNGGLLPATVVPGPGGAPTALLPGAVSPTHGAGMGYHRFRSRYAGNY